MKSPRLCVSISNEDYELLRRVSAVVGVSMASLVREYLELSRPVLEDLAKLGEAFQAAANARTALQREAVARVVDGMSPVIEGQLEGLQGSFEALFSELLDLAGGEAPAQAEGPDPRPSNTGVRSQMCGEGPGAI